ncbi:hypothetical protein BC831DRAFT_412582 [Entophlyctis helioformis]|nr:hypothetical protein BC831DRAFT_412582 [Entophlyctis helioformis]
MLAPAESLLTLPVPQPQPPTSRPFPLLEPQRPFRLSWPSPASTLAASHAWRRLSPNAVPLVQLVVLLVVDDLPQDTSKELLLFVADHLAGKHVPEPTTLAEFAAGIRHVRLAAEADADTADTQLEPWLVERVSQVASSPTLMDEFFDEAESLLGPDADLQHADAHQLRRLSAFGLFVRKCVVQYRSLEFGGTMAFYARLLAYCTGDRLSDNAYESTSLINAARFIDKQVELLEQSSGMPAPRELQEQLQQIAEALPGQAKIHYLAYLNCLRSGEHEGALVALSRFVDTGGIKVDMADGGNRQIPLHYAALNLATLYTRLGYPQMALVAVNQAIPYARQAHAEECLSFLLSWLQRLNTDWGREHASSVYGTMPTEKQALDTLTDRTRRLGQHALNAVSYLRKAEWGLVHGKSPVYVFHALQVAQTVIEQYGLDGMAATAEIVRAGVWEVYGNPRMTRAAVHHVLHGGAEETSADDLSLAYAKSAWLEAQEGRYDEALRILDTAKAAVPVIGAFQASQHWVRTRWIVLFERALNTGDLDGAERALNGLRGHCAKHGREMLLSAEARLAQKSGRPDEAYRLLCEVCEPSTGSTTSLEHITNLLRMADLFLDSGREGAITALPVILKCAAAADKYHMDLVRVLALVRLSHILLHLQHVRQAHGLLDELMPTVLSRGSAADRGYAYSVQAQTMLAMGSLDQDKDSEGGDGKQDWHGSAIVCLQHAVDCYRAVQAADKVRGSLALLAMACHAAGRTDGRNGAVQQLRLLK